MTDPDRDLAANYFNRRLAAGYRPIPAHRHGPAARLGRTAGLASVSAMYRSRWRARWVARATEQHRHDTAPKEEL